MLRFLAGLLFGAEVVVAPSSEFGRAGLFGSGDRFVDSPPFEFEQARARDGVGGLFRGGHLAPVGEVRGTASGFGAGLLWWSRARSTGPGSSPSARGPAWSWRVTHTDWKRRRVYVEPTDLPGKSRWFGLPQPLSFALTDAMRRVVLDGTLDEVQLSKRAITRLESVRAEYAPVVAWEGRVVATWDRDDTRWWTWAGARANACLTDALYAADPSMVDLVDRLDNRYVRVTAGVTPGEIRAALTIAREKFGEDFGALAPSVNPEAVKRLKFADLIPLGMATRTVAARDIDRPGASDVAQSPPTFPTS